MSMLYKNLRALKFSHVNKICIFQCMCKIFCVEFQRYLWNSTQNILPIHWKMHILLTCENLRALRFKSSSMFLKCPPGHDQHRGLWPNRIPSWYRHRCHGKSFRIVGPLLGESISDQYILLLKGQQCTLYVFISFLAWTSCWINKRVVDLGLYAAHVKSL